MNYLFLIGVLLIPFDNLFFAPTQGWATISPYFFLLYSLFAFFYYRVVDRILIRIAVVLLTVVLVFSFNYFFFPPDVSAFFKSLSGLVLGFTFLTALYFYLKPWEGTINVELLNRLGNYVFVGYFISYFYGLIYLLAFSLGLDFIVNIYDLIQARTYLERLQFSFTEPSFISIHLFGILFIFIYFLFKLGASTNVINRLSLLFLVFVITTIVFGGSLRFLIDFAFFALLVSAIFLVRTFRLGSLPILIFSIPILSFILFYFLSPIIFSRFDHFDDVSSFIYADESLSARYFRINALVKGLIANDHFFYLGAGLSNSWQVLHVGFEAAFRDYRSPYLIEVLGLYNKVETNYFNMPLRIISEFGVFVFLLLVFIIFRIRHLFLFFLVLYFYLQFDSYAFYLIWFYIFLINYEHLFIGDRLSNDFFSKILIRL